MTDTEHFLLNCLGADYEFDLEFADKFAEDFRCDIYDAVDKSTLLDAASSNNRFMGINFILEEICLDTINRACDELGLEEEKFDYYINALDTHLYYGEEGNMSKMYSWEDLENIAGVGEEE